MAKSKRTSDVKANEEQGGMTLDPMEVMKAMLAQKGKGKQVQSASEDEDGEEDESEDESEGAVSEEEEEKDGDEDSGSEAESSRSAELRNAQQQSSPISRIPTSRVVAKPKQEPFQSTKPPSDTTFESLGLSKPLIAALATINIKKPTEIQSACLGPIMAGRDCIGGAKTGSGKTLAFALPIVEGIARDPFGVWAVVLTPTR
jgi:ATP-dependent RNA helicase DDX49/DBP8